MIEHIAVSKEPKADDMHKYSQEDHDGIRLYIHEDYSHVDLLIDINDVGSDLPNRELKVVLR